MTISHYVSIMYKYYFKNVLFIAYILCILCHMIIESAEDITDKRAC